MRGGSVGALENNFSQALYHHGSDNFGVQSRGRKLHWRVKPVEKSALHTVATGQGKSTGYFIELRSNPELSLFNDADEG